MSKSQELPPSDFLNTWLKGRVQNHSSSLSFDPSFSFSVTVVPSHNRIPPFPSSVEAIAMIPDKLFCKTERKLLNAQELETAQVFDTCYGDVTLASVERYSEAAYSPTLHVTSDSAYFLYVSAAFLRQNGFKNGDAIWFRSSRAFPLTTVYLEYVDEGESLTEDLCCRFVQHLRNKCKSSVVVVKQDAMFRYELSSRSSSYLHHSIGNILSKMTGGQKQTSPDLILTFSVLGTGPFQQGRITMETEIYVLPPPHLPTVTPGSVSPVEERAGNPRHRHISGSYHPMSGLQRPVLSPSPDSTDERALSPDGEPPSGPPALCLPIALPLGGSGKQTRKKTSVRAPTEEELMVETTPPIQGEKTLSYFATEQEPQQHFFPSSYPLEVKPFYHDSLDKNTILIPKTFEPTLSSWLGPVSSADYVAIYPADTSGKRVYFAQEISSGQSFQGPVAPYYAVVKFFTPPPSSFSPSFSSDSNSASLGSSGSLSSLRSSSLSSLTRESYPAASALDMPEAFLHPESLFSVFPHARPPWDDSPHYISLELVEASDIPCVSHITVSLVSEVVQNFPISLISKPTLTYLTEPRCICLGEVFSLKCGDNRIFLKVTDLSQHRKKGPIEAVPFGTTSARTLISYSNTSVFGFIPDMSYLAEFGYSCGMQYFWDSSVPLGLEETFYRLLALCLPILEKSVCKAGIANRGILVSGPSGCGKTTVIKAVAKYCHMRVAEFNCSEMLLEMPSQMPFVLSSFFRAATQRVPCIIVLHQAHHLGKDREGSRENSKPTAHFAELLDTLGSIPVFRDFPLIVVGTTSEPSKIGTKLSSYFLHEIEMPYPSIEDTQRMWTGLCSKTATAKDVDFWSLAKKSKGLVLSDLVSVVSRAAHEAKNDIVTYLFSSGNPNLNWEIEQDIAISGVVISEAHLNSILDSHLASQGSLIGTQKIPSVKWADIGGLEEAKREIMDTIQLPLKFPQMFSATTIRSGILLYGAPGTGKTLIAKAVATECSMNFISVKGPELLDMYVGQSESNIREVFRKAITAAPCVMFFDELDSLAPSRGKSSDSGGVMDRVVSQLLTELDHIHDDGSFVFVIGATNRPDLIDPALLRPGRFDRLVYLEISDDVESCMKVLEAVTRKMNIVGVDLRHVASRCPRHVTGADLSALCNQALQLALRREILHMESCNLTDDAWDNNKQLEVTNQDFLTALQTLVPSVTEEDLSKYQNLRGFRKQPIVSLREHPEENVNLRSVRD